ncbi:MAG: PspC domain-containing protein [Tannerellaceae bacterium]|jgi:phage shock protein PspC (stress-responsive transcriptional regulator)|nr:PspC domain-containing protein [Tannerellaceae bacterium]
MKKTLTVNLGGTVFHIDEDAYRLLEKYLSNLRIHFGKEEGVDEIMNDFELRISEILSERIRLGYEVITIEHVEAVIKQMGKVEDIFGEESTHSEESTHESTTQQTRERVNKRFFRNPDDRMLGGVCSGLAAYMGWDPTPVRLLLFFLMFFYGVTIPIYLILWLVVPLAQTATEKLQMRGESITVENIGKTVTDGFEKVVTNIKDYADSPQSRTLFQKVADTFVAIIGVFLKVAAILLGIILFPVVLVLLFVFIVIIIALIIGGIGGGFGLLYALVPSAEYFIFQNYPEWMWAVFSLCGILLLVLPILAILYTVCSRIFNFKPFPPALRVVLIVLWFIALAANLFILFRYGNSFWELNHHTWNPALWRSFNEL